MPLSVPIESGARLMLAMEGSAVFRIRIFSKDICKQNKQMPIDSGARLMPAMDGFSRL